jgi:hypothetical protein
MGRLTEQQVECQVYIHEFTPIQPPYTKKVVALPPVQSKMIGAQRALHCFVRYRLSSICLVQLYSAPLDCTQLCLTSLSMAHPHCQVFSSRWRHRYSFSPLSFPHLTSASLNFSQRHSASLTGVKAYSLPTKPTHCSRGHRKGPMLQCVTT